MTTYAHLRNQKGDATIHRDMPALARRSRTADPQTQDPIG